MVLRYNNKMTTKISNYPIQNSALNFFFYKVAIFLRFSKYSMKYQVIQNTQRCMDVATIRIVQILNKGKTDYLLRRHWITLETTRRTHQNTDHHLRRLHVVCNHF